MSNSTNETAILQQLPNPFTNLAFLPPDLAFQIQVARYILVGTLGANVWDILSNLSLEYQLLTKWRISFPTAIYFASRIISFSYVLTSTLFETTAIDHCKAVEQYVDIVYPVSMILTCFLFFFRIRAVFDGQRWIIAGFFILWLGVVGSNLPVINAVGSGNLGPTKYCLNTSIKSYAFIAPVFVCIHDTMVFCAISFRMMLNSASAQGGALGRVKTLAFGNYLPSFSKMLLLDGQMYFLYTIGFSLVSVIMVYQTSLQTTYRTMFTVPNVFITNSMACRIFRKTRFAVGGSHSGITSDSQNVIPLALRRAPRSNRDDTFTSSTNTIDVTVTKDVETFK